jgi:malonate decarboxylase beta subunit
MATPFSALSAAERAAALADPGTLHLLSADPAASVVTAQIAIDGRRALVALTDGRLRGGTVGRVEARHLSELVALAERRRIPVVMGWNTGGVRVQEGPAALGEASALGVRLTRLALSGTPLVTFVSGPRGCFGAPSVIAAVGHATMLTRDALWGLTGPQLLEGGAEDHDAARAVMAAPARRRAGLRPASRRTPRQRWHAVAAALAAPLTRVGATAALDRCLAVTGRLLAQLDPPEADAAPRRTRQRDFFAYSFRGQWRTTEPSVRLGLVHAAWGELRGTRTLGIILGPERSPHGIGVAEAHAVLQAVRQAVRTAPGVPIVTFLFCRGHASDLRQERAGISRALAECLRGLTVARLAGHPLVCVLGGGAYGAAYLSIAAPSHRILAIQGTTVAPMAPRVLATFRRLRALQDAAQTGDDLAALIPEIRIVESVVRLPRALGEEFAAVRRSGEGRRTRVAYRAVVHAGTDSSVQAVVCVGAAAGDGGAHAGRGGREYRRRQIGEPLEGAGHRHLAEDDDVSVGRGGARGGGGRRQVAVHVPSGEQRPGLRTRHGPDCHRTTSVLRDAAHERDRRRERGIERRDDGDTGAAAHRVLGHRPIDAQHRCGRARDRLGRVADRRAGADDQAGPVSAQRVDRGGDAARARVHATRRGGGGE